MRRIRFALLYCTAAALWACGDPSGSIETSPNDDNWIDDSALESCSKMTISSVSANTSEAINPPKNVLDGRLSTRWSGLGPNAYITADLGALKTVCAVRVAWYLGSSRTNIFSVSLSKDGTAFTPVFSGTSSGTTTSLQSYSFTHQTARYVRLTVQRNSQNNWASVTEFQISGGAPGTTPPPGPPPPESSVYDNFNGALYNLTTDGSMTPNGRWEVGYMSEGFVRTVQDPTNSFNQYLVAAPKLDVLNAVRIDTTKSWKGIRGKLRARLDKQLRPVGWYTLWPFIAYVDETTHYYFNLKTDGWELGKKDNDHHPREEIQEYLATGNSPRAVLGQWNTIEWWVAPDATTANLRIRVDVNGVTLVNMVDNEGWQRNGRTGSGASSFFQNAMKRVSLYSEASQVSWDDVSITEAISVPTR